MPINRSAILLCLALCGAGPGTRAEEPLSAIDWLSQSVATPVSAPASGSPLPGSLPGATGPDPITVAPISGPSLDALGLFAAETTGLPRDLWGPTPSVELAAMLRAERLDTLPSVQALLYRLMLAELDPPIDSAGGEALYLARVDRLLDLGALDQALALLELPEKPRPEPFRRWFDAALLIGEEDRACETMRKTPDVAPTFPARIFCLARGGDWTAAALSLRTGEALGYIEPDMAELLARFLDPELFEGEPELPLPERPSPLVLRMMEAVGQPLPISGLPVAFAHSDLRTNSGWKARIEAGERLARTGALAPNRLMGFYSERRAAASGGVWDRVAAVQALDLALTERDPDRIAQALEPAWARMTDAELEVPFAALFGERLAAIALPGAAGATAFRVGLLSDAYETIARARRPTDGIETFLIGLAGGNVVHLAPPDQLGGAIQRGFAEPAPRGEVFDRMLAEGRLGEAVLRATSMISDGAKGDLRHVTEALALFRSVGLESTARRAALELLLLERRG